MLLSACSSVCLSPTAQIVAMYRRRVAMSVGGLATELMSACVSVCGQYEAVTYCRVSLIGRAPVTGSHVTDDVTVVSWCR